jgi:hypothetical protein
MVDPTARDRVWRAAWTVCCKKGDRVEPARIADLADVSERMARDCLLVMWESDVLDRETRKDGSVRYRCGRDVTVDV